jgi:PIN domain nuclease of toxin-antitoxin system|tara:strand:- start:2764 stop:3333 length:570 start_codon:yes stop_codon:yes gene_type:complete
MSEEDLWNTIEADAEAFKDLTTEAGTELAALIRQLGVVQSSVWETEEKLKGLKQQRDRYLHDLIPAKMQETGLDEVKVDGNKVSLATFVSGTMPKDPLERDRALSHLREIGASDFIKNEVSVSFPVSEDNRARAMQADLEDKGFDTAAKTWVEPQTLKKLIRERVEAGQEIDLEIFNAHIGTIAKIRGE